MHYVFIIFDESGSMGDFAGSVRVALQELYESKPSECRMGFIGFSDYAIYGDTVESVIHQRGSTNIAGAFELLQVRMEQVNATDDVSIVFISDGCDSEPKQCLLKLWSLKPCIAPCKLLCVAIGDNFPTSMVLNNLRPRFNGSDALPAVISMSSVDDVALVFSELEGLLFYGEEVLSEYDSSTSIRALSKGCVHTYNAAVNRCTSTSTDSFVFEELNDAIDTLEHIVGLALKLDTSSSLSFLPSQRLEAQLYNTEAVVATALSMIGQMHLMLERINTGAGMLQRCTDAERQKVLSYGHIVGRHTKTAQAYHGAQYPVSRGSLRQFLATYEPTPHDETLEEKINWCTQAEYFADAKAHARDILPNVPTLIHVIEYLPLICRTLTMKKPLPQGLHMNCWLGKVEAMPTILTHITTYDFFERFNNKASSHGEIVSGIMLVTKHPSGSLLSRGIGKHLASYLLTRNADLFFPDADLATWAMVAVHILGQQHQAEWMSDELASLKFMHSAIYAQDCSWTRYLMTVWSGSFRQSLITNNDIRHCECPHLNKFILAVFFSKRLSLQYIEERRDAALVEFFGRLSFVSVTDLFTGQFVKKPVDVLDGISFENLPTLRESIRSFRAKLRRSITKSSRFYLEDSVALEPLTSRRFQAWNLDPLIIEQVFNSIAQGKLSPITPEHWASLALTGFYCKTSHGRSELNCLETLATKRDEIERHLIKKFIAQLHTSTPGYVQMKLCGHVVDTHYGLPVLISQRYAEEFFVVHGVDLMDLLDINDYGLSRSACMFRHCPHFARPLGKKATCKKGLPRMGDKLMQHLAPLCVVGGLHRAVLQHPELDETLILEQTMSRLPLVSLVVHEVSSLVANIKAIRQWEPTGDIGGLLVNACFDMARNV